MSLSLTPDTFFKLSVYFDTASIILNIIDEDN